MVQNENSKQANILESKTIESKISKNNHEKLTDTANNTMNSVEAAQQGLICKYSIYYVFAKFHQKGKHDLTSFLKKHHLHNFHFSAMRYEYFWFQKRPFLSM